MPLVELENVGRAYGGRTVLSGVSLRVEAGEILAVHGPSGSGKTTLLNVIGGLCRANRGRVLIAGQELGALPDRELSRFRNERIAFVFQFFNLLDHLTAIENVLLPSFFAVVTDTKAETKALSALDRVGLGDRALDRAATLSGGQRQRVAIARALFSRPALVLADEPTGNLDAQTGAEVIDLFKRVVDEENLTLIVVTHEERVSRAARRVVRLEDGMVKD